MNNQGKHGRIYWLILLISSFVLTFSFVAEGLWNINPCKLCLLQRGLYCLIFLLGSVGLAVKGSRKALKIALIGILSFNALVASYHTGIQEGVFKDKCKAASIRSKADFIQVLSKDAPCAKKWSPGGINAPIWNLILSMVLIYLLTRPQSIQVPNKPS